jgi:hypothetical protein
MLFTRGPDAAFLSGADHSVSPCFIPARPGCSPAFYTSAVWFASPRFIPARPGLFPRILYQRGLVCFPAFYTSAAWFVSPCFIPARSGLLPRVLYQHGLVCCPRVLYQHGLVCCSGARNMRRSIFPTRLKHMTRGGLVSVSRRCTSGVGIGSLLPERGRCLSLRSRTLRGGAAASRIL